MEGGAAVRLTGEGGDWPQESVDRTRVLFRKSQGGHIQVWSASVNGGDERPVTEMTSQGWVPARSGIYFIDGSPPHFSLGYFDFVTWHARKIADLPGLFIVWGPTLSPDGHTVLFTGREHSESDIFLVEGFR